MCHVSLFFLLESRLTNSMKKLAVYAFESFVGSSLLGFLPAEAWIHCLTLRHRPARSVREIFAAFFLWLQWQLTWLGWKSEINTTRDCEELQSRRSVEFGTCQTVLKWMRLHLSTWPNLMSSILWGTPLPLASRVGQILPKSMILRLRLQRGPGWCVRWEDLSWQSGIWGSEKDHVGWINDLAGIGHSGRWYRLFYPSCILVVGSNSPTTRVAAFQVMEICDSDLKKLCRTVGGPVSRAIRWQTSALIQMSAAWCQGCESHTATHQYPSLQSVGRNEAPWLWVRVTR